MGSEVSQEKTEQVSLDWYRSSFQRPCLFPDVGIDESLLKYSGTNSDAMLQAYSNELLNKIFPVFKDDTSKSDKIR